MEEKARGIHKFWFGENFEKEPLAKSENWFKKDSQFDQEILRLFEADILKAMEGEYDHWLEDIHSRVSLIILLDQFPRNIYRESAQSFAGDKRALSLLKQCLVRALDRELGPVERLFLYIPMMHSEDLEDQRTSLRLFNELKDHGEQAVKDALFSSYDYAIRHYEIIKRFGRYPHRNKALGRASSKEELEFLEQPGSSF